MGFRTACVLFKKNYKMKDKKFKINYNKGWKIGLVILLLYLFYGIFLGILIN